MKSKRLWRHLAISLLAAAPAGGFLFGVLNAGDPDPNPVGRVFHAFLMAALTPLHAGFPEVRPGQTINAWPHIAICFLGIFGWFLYRDGKTVNREDERKL